MANATAEATDHDTGPCIGVTVRTPAGTRGRTNGQLGIGHARKVVA